MRRMVGIKGYAGKVVDIKGIIIQIQDFFILPLLCGGFVGGGGGCRAGRATGGVGREVGPIIFIYVTLYQPYIHVLHFHEDIP